MRKTILSFVAVCALAPSGVRAQALPSIDATFTRRSADNDPDLVVVRERFDAATRTQSIYLRVNDASEDLQYISGRLRVRGATVVAILTSAEQMAGGDLLYGIPGADYTPNAPRRALDGFNPAVQIPMRNSGLDAVRIENADQAKFWMGTTDDIDDLRIILRYPAEPGPASFDIELFHAQRADPLAWPLTTQGGIQVGSLVDAVPDDGDYSEVFEVRNLKLRIEDLDLRERDVVVGSVTDAGGELGPATLHVENFALGVDLDQDNGFDQNGLISPIPAGSDLEHVSWRIEPLVHAGGVAAMIPAENVRLMNAPARLVVGEQAEVLLSVTVPPGLPFGPYSGRLTVFEDNDLDQRPDPAEPADTTAISVIVVGDEDALVDFERPPLDLGFPDDAAEDDAAVTGDAAMNGDAAVTGDSAVTGDGAMNGDSVVTGDGAPTGDGAVTGDASDAAAEAGVDGAQDATVASEFGVDLGPTADARPLDLGGSDGGPDTDARSTADAGGSGGPLDFGTPRGGALSCSTGGAWSGSAVFGLVLVGLARRRRGRP